MKNLLPLLIIIFTISVFTSCQNDSPSTKKSKTEQRKKLNKVKKADKKKVNKKKNTKAKPKPLPPISKLEKSDKQTRVIIQNVSGKNIAKDKQPFRLTEDKITVRGIAVDTPRKTAAVGVYVKIGDQYFKANYGKPSKDFANRTKNPKYGKAGFVATIPKDKIKRGDYELSVCVVSSNRKTYYEQKDKIKIKVR